MKREGDRRLAAQVSPGVGELMLKFDRILFPTDFSDCASHALPHTLRLARSFRSEIHILHALVLHDADPGNAAHPLPDVEGLYQLLEAQAESQLSQAVQDHGEELTFRRAQLRSLSAASAILEYAAEHSIDLITLGTHGRRGLRRLLLGSVAEEVVRLAPCPVLTVPERAGATPDRVERILVPVDFSEHARLALTFATELAAIYGAGLDLLHVIDQVVYPDFYPPLIPPIEAARNELQARSEEKLAELLAQVPQAKGTTHVGWGQPYPEIVHLAEQLPADLIVLASHGLTGFRHMLLGSVAEQVVRAAPCPVFTLKTLGGRGESPTD